MAEPTAAVVAPPPAERREPEALEFPGCHPVRIRRDELDVGDFRIEYWDADTEIAMICEPVSYYHERPASRLARLAGLIAAARGAAIEAAGHTDLLVRNARGERQRIMQADQILFLRPAQAEPAGNAIEVGTDALPEWCWRWTTPRTCGAISSCTSLRCGWTGAVAAEPPGVLRVTIHVREGREGRLSPRQRAWRFQRRRRSTNEPEQTAEVLNRVGREWGRRHSPAGAQKAGRRHNAATRSRCSTASPSRSP